MNNKHYPFVRLLMVTYLGDLLAIVVTGHGIATGKLVWIAVGCIIGVIISLIAAYQIIWWHNQQIKKLDDSIEEYPTYFLHQKDKGDDKNK